MTDQRSGRVRKLLVPLAIGVVSSLFTMGAIAVAGGGPTFTDVGPGHPFYNEIELVAGACVAQGFPDGSYKPGQNVNRGSMAAFLARVGGRIGATVPIGGSPTHGSATPNVFSSWTNIAAGGIQLPNDGCNRTIRLDGNASIFTNQTAANTCHSTLTCNVEVGLFVGNVQVGSSLTRLNTDDAADSVSVTGLYETTSNSVVYVLKWRTYNVKPAQARVASRTIYGTYFPLDTGYVPL